jgi:hypothetical protein
LNFADTGDDAAAVVGSILAAGVGTCLGFGVGTVGVGSIVVKDLFANIPCAAGSFDGVVAGFGAVVCISVCLGQP